MEFTLKTFIFYGFALLTVASAFVVVTVRNIVHAAFSLMVTLFGVAGLYVFLQADFLAATQVIVYVGGILVLILFGVMMTSGRLEMRIHIETGATSARCRGCSRIANAAFDCHRQYTDVEKFRG